MKTINRICIPLILSTALVTQSAYGETSGATNHIDFSAFYREWAISPSNALVKITPPVMELAASAKTNAAGKTVLHNSLWRLFSTNTILNGRSYLLDMKCKLIADAFRVSDTYQTPQEEEIIPLAKTLAFIRNSFTPDLPFPIEYLDQSAYDAMAQKFKESGVPENKWPMFSNNGLQAYSTKRQPVLIIPSDFDPDVLWIHYRHFTRLKDELGSADHSVYHALISLRWIAGELSQEERDKIFAEIVSLQMLDPDEERSIADDLKVDTAAIQAQPTPAE